MNINLKRTIPVIMTGIIVTAMFMTGCGNNNNTSGVSQSAATADSVSDFKYFYRNLQPRNYIAPAKAFAGGSGTEADPYQISNAAELACLSKLSNSEDTKVSDILI